MSHLTVKPLCRTRSLRTSTRSPSGDDVMSNPALSKKAKFSDDSGVVRDRYTIASMSLHQRRVAPASRWQVSHTSGCCPVLIWSSTRSASRFFSGHQQKRGRVTCGTEFVIEPVTEHHARLARQAYADFGRGSGHRAGLNFGDCLSYALALDTREPLLWMGDEFGHTGIASALNR